MAFPYLFAGLATIAAVLVCLGMSILVGRARQKYGVPAPAMSGHPAFERAQRVHLNTLEQIVLFLPMLWLAAVAFDDRWAGAAGALWVVGRLVYARAYYGDAAKRGPGFMLTIAAFFILLILAAIGMLRGVPA